MQFDGSWTVSLAPGSTPPPASAAWPAIANGQLAIVPALDASAGFDATRSVVAVPPDRGYGRALPNFHFSRVRVALVPPPGGSPAATATLLSQAVPTGLSLDMRRGAMTLTSADAATGCTVAHELRALMHLPGFAMHSVTVVVPAGLAPPGVGATLQVQHEVRVPAGSTSSAFSGESLAASNGTSFFVLQGDAQCAVVGEDGRPIAASVSCASTYLVECRNSPSVGQQLPPPAYAEQRGNRAVATFYVSASPTPTSASPTTLRFHVLTSVSTSLEAGGSRRSLLGVAAQANASGATAAATAAALVTAHEAAWRARWATRVDVSGADARVRWALRYAFYNLHACTRPLGGAVDLAGTSLAAGRADDFVGALLTVCAPECAWSALEGRWASLGYATDLAADSGLPGARFPYAGELDGDEAAAGDAGSAAAALAGYSPSAWWQLAGAPGGPRLHATSMAAISAWNYFRATQDGQWLAARGYPILKAAADALAAYCVRPDPNAIAFRLPASVGLDVMRPSKTDPVLEVAAIVAVMRCATEAAYQLGVVPPALWTAVRYGLALPKLAAAVAASPNVLASDAGGPTPIGFPNVPGSVAQQAALAPGGERVAVPEALLAFAEPVASLADALNLNPGTLPQNLAYWGEVVRTGASPFLGALGDAVVLNATAQAAQLGDQATRAAKAAAFLARLDAFLDRHSDLGPSSSGGNGSGWGNVRPGGGGPESSNDLGLSSALTLAFVQGLAGVHLQGGITQAQFVYSSLGVNAATTSCLPETWSSISIMGLGADKVDVVLLNNRGGGRGAGTSYTGWSVPALTF